MELQQTTATCVECYQDSHLTVDFEREIALMDGAPMKLTAKAFSLLAFLARHPGQLVPRETLLMLVWGYGQDIRTRTLDVHVRRLRKSLGKYGTVYIETIFSVGYRFQPYKAHTPMQASAASSVAAMGASESTPWRWKMSENPAY
ncbi:MAG TPA: winged helix-turn-helix domain-containing protein [Bryobacteraceae bacterium]|jgi:DNA-binding response OmpR family regulator|nr:winged helix-turn-helix domain-containing protein [Bryobacteraceae bacterium]